MQTYLQYLNEMVSKQKDAFSEFPGITWLNPYQAGEYQHVRDVLLKNNPTTMFKGTKIVHNSVSKGCQLCGQGYWSCLFITGKCNAGCFYCPAPQHNDELPSTQGLTFKTPEAYAEYINHFKFKGVSFSGGEPLLFFDRTLAYLKAVRAMCDPNIYTWMYTNGILGDEEKFRLLAEAGLNEIRFDIGATNYSLEKAGLAVRHIKTVTVEIPAVPEEKELLMSILPEMKVRGIKHLNLHQLRLTEYNALKLLKRGYTYIPAERPIVLESELAALEIIDFARRNTMDIGINYCSFFFKNRFQKAGFRKRINSVLASSPQTLTEKGTIRSMLPSSVLYNSYFLNDANDQDHSGQEWLVLQHKRYGMHTSNVSESIPIPGSLSGKVIDLLAKEPEQIPGDSVLFSIWQQEYIEQALREY